MRRSLLVALVLGLGLGLAPSAARADFGFVPGSLTAELVDAAGNPEVRAGAHPDRFRIGFAFNELEEVNGQRRVDGNFKDLKVSLPSGFIGDPTAVPTCPREVIGTQGKTCPPETQIGVIEVAVGFGSTSPIYNVEPQDGDLADFGFSVFGLTTAHLTARMEPDGQGLTIETRRTGQDFQAFGMSLELWGVPADHQTDTTIPRRPLLTIPTRCDVPPTVTLRASSWQDPGSWVTAAKTMPPLVGCDALAFDPRLDFRLDSAAADTPTGMRLDLLVPQHEDPDGQAGDRVKGIELQFPDGVALSPGFANGLTACDEAAVHIGEAEPATCPPSSTVGAVELSTPLLDRPLAGKLYMGPQLPGTDYQLFAVLRASNIDLKLRVPMHADPVTGRLTARVSGLPALPFDRLSLSFAGGSRAPLVTSPTCGAGVASATFSPYGGGPSVASSDVVATTTDPAGRPCPEVLPFAPVFVGGTLRARAGASSPLAVTIRRRDGEQLLHRFSMTLPPGVSARLPKARRCSAAAAATASCPAASRVGSAVVEAGTGASPLPLRGDVFLTSSYKHAPFGLAIVFRAVAGPFDLGTISVRAALSLDSRTGQLTVNTDALPRVVRGIPLRIQTVALDIDRPGFIVNPTSCAVKEVAAAIGSTGGALARPKSRFAVGGCRALRFRPKISMALTNRRQLHAGGRPGLRLRFRGVRGDANLAKATVALPKLLEPAPTTTSAICSLEQAKDGRCPAAARVGSAVARTPLLSTPLKGSVYIVQPPDNGVPDFWALIRGSGVSMGFRMATKVRDGRMSGTLVDLPDLPLSTFTMTFASGRRGVFSATRSPCVRGRVRQIPMKALLTGHSRATHRVKSRAGVAPGC